MLHRLRPFIRIAFLAFLAAVLFLAVNPYPLDAAIPGSDKAHHFLAFVGLSGLAGLGWPPSSREFGLGLLVLGAVIELLQGTSFVGRDMSFFDWLADAAGVATGLISASLAVQLSPLFNRR